MFRRVLFLVACKLFLSTPFIAAMNSGVGGMADEKKHIAIQGAQLAISAPMDQVDFPDGCLEAFQITGNRSPEFLLDESLSERGAVSFWFKLPQTLETGVGKGRERYDLLELKDLLRISVESNQSHIHFRLIFTEEINGRTRVNRDYEVRGVLPGLDDEWMHFYARWNAETGERNAWLNGIPFFVEEVVLSPWTLGEATRLTVGSKDVSLADIRVTTDLHLNDFIPLMKEKGVYESTASLFGMEALGYLDTHPLKGSLIYQQELTSEPDDGWIMEGPGVLDFTSSGLRMQSQYPDGDEGHIVYWCPEIFPESFVAEWEIEILSDYGLCIVFFAASGTEGKDLFDSTLAPRDGVFQQYTQGDVESYHISYYANVPQMPRPTSNLRKNPGFFLMANGPAGISHESQRSHLISLVKDGGHIRLAVDGVLAMEFIDDGEQFGSIYGEGRIGFRQMRWTKTLLNNFRVYALKK